MNRKRGREEEWAWDMSRRIDASVLNALYQKGIEYGRSLEAEEQKRRPKNPVLHEDVQVEGCDCGGCYGESGTPYVAMSRSAYEHLNEEFERLSNDE
jgi:hypothetical protein